MSKISIGGQAVIEGVMMRGRTHWAMAVRKPDGSIAIKDKPINDLSKKYPFLGWPVLRGAVSLVQSLVIGVQAISTSAQMSMGEEERELTTWEMGATIAFSVVFAALLFMAVPYFLTRYVQSFKLNHVLFTTIEGVIRISIFVGYVGVISLIKDIRKVFEYHGAEHKVINVYDKGLQPSIENSHKYSTVHPMCGTSFVLLVLVISIIAFSFLPVGNFGYRFLGKILIVPLIAGISYEIIRLARKRPNKFLSIILYPGLLLQKLTTKEPSDKQVEVSIAAFNRVVELELKS